MIPESVNDRLGRWLAAALDSPEVCAEMKADIEAWFLASRLPRQEDEIRKAALEEAAEVADAHWNNMVVAEARGESDVGHAIRALKGGRP